MTALTAWQYFYEIVGSSAGALIGLQFVAMALIANTTRQVVPGQAEAGSAFATPTIVHFASALMLAAILSAPWHSVGAAAVVWGLFGSIGIVYAIIVTWRMRAQKIYRPVFEDWLFHALLPLAAYAMLAGSALEASWSIGTALFGVAAAVLLLLLIGIHNAWDAVTYHVFFKKRPQAEVGR